MIENNKVEIVEEDNTPDVGDNRLLKVGTIIICSIILLMIICLVMIFILDK